MKRTVSLVIVLALVLTMVSGLTFTASAEAARPKLTYWLELAADKVAPIFTNYGEAEMWKYVMKETGVDVEFLHPPAGEAKTKFSTMVASRSLPDIFEYDVINNYNGGALKAIDDGIIVKLNDLIASSAPNLTKVMDEHPDWVKQWVADDGTKFCFPFIRDHSMLLTSWGPQMRLDWLEQIGYSIDNLPKTLAQWEEILIAMKEKGFTEYPFVPVNIGSFGDNSYIPGAFGVGWEFYTDTEGALQYGPVMPGFKDFIALMAKWNSLGLVDPDWTAGLDTGMIRGKILGNNAGVYFSNVGGGIGYYYDTLNAGVKTAPEHPAGFQVTGVPCPVLNEGEVSRFGARDYAVAGMTAYVTTACKDLEAAAKFLDYGYGEAGHELFNFGIEGVSFNYIDAKEYKAVIDVSEIDPMFPLWTEKVTNDPDRILTLAMSNYMRSHMGGTFAQDVRYFLQYLPYTDQTRTVNIWTSSSDFSSKVPRLYFTTEESEVVSQYMAEIKTFRDETLTQFITGELAMDQWESVFIEGLKSMHVDEIIAINRAAYERAKNR